MFLLSKSKWKYCDNAWFTTTPLGWNQLHLIVDKLTLTFLHLKDKLMFNKTKKGVKITHMEKTFVPHEYNMEITSHKDFISYKK
jgi:hypothetical protein